MSKSVMKKLLISFYKKEKQPKVMFLSFLVVDVFYCTAARGNVFSSQSMQGQMSPETERKLPEQLHTFSNQCCASPLLSMFLISESMMVVSGVQGGVLDIAAS